MRRKLCCMVIVLALMLHLLPQPMLASALDAGSGVEALSVSEAGIEWIKEFEGFSGTAYESGGQWYIGYGMSCAPDDYPNGITEEEADALLREKLASCSDTLNAWLESIDFSASQTQFDALASFTYSFGDVWMRMDCQLAQLLKAGGADATDIAFVNAFGIWCHENKTILPPLITRRLAEACLFLYGDYSGERSDDFSYLTLDTDGGDVERDIVFYEKGRPYGELPEAEKDGSIFSGWADETGAVLTPDAIAGPPVALTAIWTQEAPWVNPYSDMTENDWFYEYVADLSRSGVIGGYPDGTFGPANAVTLGEALKLILLASGRDAQAPAGGHWAGGYLALAKKEGILGANDPDDPDGAADRLLIARIAAKALALSPSQADSPFADTQDGYVLALYEAGIVNGDGSGQTLVYHPESSITRAEISAIIWRIQNTDVHAGQIQYKSYWVDILEDVPVNTYDAACFSLSDGRMRYDAPGVDTRTGIDVSVYQGDIDWEAVKADGIDYAIIRLGFRGYGSTGSMNLDENFIANIEGATAAGLDVGVYFFSQAITPEEAREEAEFVLHYLEGYELTYPVVFDWEVIGKTTARTYGLDTRTLCESANAFCSMIEDAGYQAMIYITSYAGYVKYDLSEVSEYDLWFAQYADVPTFYYDFAMWQYSSSGRVNGIRGDVDMNISFVDYAKN